MNARFFIAIFLFFAGCTVQFQLPPQPVVNNLPDGGKVDVLPDSIPAEYSGRPRFYWEQIEQSDSTQSFAVTNGSKDGRWLRGDSMRWHPNGPFVTIDGDTVATRDWAQLYPDSLTVFSSIYGSNNTARLGSNKNPWASPWSAIDYANVYGPAGRLNVKVGPGNYTFSGTYLSDNTTSLLQPVRDDDVFIDAANSVITYTNSPYTTGFVSDMNSGWTTSPNPIRVRFNAKELAMLTPSASIACPVLITNPNSEVTGYIGTIRSATTFGTASRYWGLELGANYVNLKVDTIWYDGDLAVSYWRSYDGAGSVNNLYQRNMKIDLSYVYVASQRGGIGGAFRVQTGATFPSSGQTDSLSTYVYKINRVDVSPTTTHDYLVDFGSQASVDIVYGNTYVADIETINGAAFEEAIFGMTVGNADTMRSSKLTYKADRIIGVDKGIFGISSVGGVFDDIDLNIDLGEVDFEVDGYITLGLASIYNSRINIHCDDCSTTYGDAVIKLNPTASAGNKITISGNWQNNTAQPVIDVSGLNSTDTLIIKNLQIRNDGSVAAINSTSAKTVYVQSAFDYNNIIKDSDITFTRLDEYAVGAPQYAQSYNTGGENTSITAGTPEQVISTTLGTTDTIAATSEFTVQSDADIEYTGSNNAVIKITAEAAIDPSTSVYALYYIAINDVIQNSSRLRVYSAGTSIQPMSVNITFIDTDADNGDVYSLYVDSTGGTIGYTVYDFRLTAEKIN